jgi:hypothetical protein
MDTTKAPRNTSIPDGEAAHDARRTVIPAPRRDGLFPGWGVRF